MAWTFYACCLTSVLLGEDHQLKPCHLNNRFSQAEKATASGTLNSPPGCACDVLADSCAEGACLSRKLQLSWMAD